MYVSLLPRRHLVLVDVPTVDDGGWQMPLGPLRQLDYNTNNITQFITYIERSRS